MKTQTIISAAKGGYLSNAVTQYGWPKLVLPSPYGIQISEELEELQTETYVQIHICTTRPGATTQNK